MYAGKNPLVIYIYRLYVMKDLVRYLRYIPCVEMFDVVSDKSCSHFSRGSYCGERGLPMG